MHFFGFVLTVIGTLYLLDLALLVSAHRVWWRRRWVKYTALTIPLLVAIGLGIWGTAHEHQSKTWIVVGAGLTSILFTQLGALLLALLAAAILRGAVYVTQNVRRPVQLTADPERRRFLRAGLAAIPLMSATAAAACTRSKRELRGCSPNVESAQRTPPDVSEVSHSSPRPLR